MWEEGTIVLTGSWLYDGSIKTEVVIQKMPVIYGVRDDEVPSELGNDQYIENYYIWYGTPGTPGVFRAGADANSLLKTPKRKQKRW